MIISPQAPRSHSGADQNGPLLTITNLSVSFPRSTATPLRAVSEVGFAIYPRQTLAVVGESGSGKSVTALSILRLLPSPPALYEHGSIVLHASGRDVELMSADDRTLRSIRGGQVGMIFQEPMTSLNPVMTISEQIVEAISLHQGLARKAARRAAIDALTQVGIRDAAERLHAYPHQFSGGMRQRVMIAMALACRPRLLIADEPTTALDVTVQAQILSLLADLKRDHGLGIVLITHDLGLVADHADAVCVMYAGRIVEFGPTREVLARPLHPYTRGLLACTPRISMQRPRLLTVQDFVARPVDCQLELPGDPSAGPLQLWWPAHPAPSTSVGEPPAPVLARIAADRWICAWPTPAAVARRSGSPPAVPPRVLQPA